MSQSRPRNVIFLLIAVLVASAAVSTSPGRTAESGPAGLTLHTDAARRYFVHTPVGVGAGAPLVVYLHGCNQTGPDAALGTRWAEVGEDRGFVSVYPEQPASANGTLCWNWFLPENQSREMGEAAIIADITRKVVVRYGIDSRRVYVIGASAGANMAGIMGAAYPDLYAAIGSVAGCPYASCGDALGAATYQAMGPRARVVPTFIAHGTADPVVPFALGEATLQSWLGANDLADDATPNSSISKVPAGVSNRSAPPNIAPGTGDPCIAEPGGPPTLPCLGGPAGIDVYPHTIRTYLDASFTTVIEFWAIHGAGHAWIGGDTRGSFTDPIGPHLTEAAYDFFSRHTLTSSLVPAGPDL